MNIKNNISFKITFSFALISAMSVFFFLMSVFIEFS